MSLVLLMAGVYARCLGEVRGFGWYDCMFESFCELTLLR